MRKVAVATIAFVVGLALLGVSLRRYNEYLSAGAVTVDARAAIGQREDSCVEVAVAIRVANPSPSDVNLLLVTCSALDVKGTVALVTKDFRSEGGRTIKGYSTDELYLVIRACGDEAERVLSAAKSGKLSIRGLVILRDQLGYLVSAPLRVENVTASGP